MAQASDYALDKPSKVLELDLELQEISGLSFSQDYSTLSCINDELGYLYLLSPTTGEIVRKIEFNKPGDYEGVEVIGNTAVVMKNSGTLYFIEDYTSSEANITKYNTELNDDNDLEGLAFDANKNQLLLACKANGFIEGQEKNKKIRSIFPFDLKSKTLLMDERLEMHQSSFYTYVQNHADHPQYDKWIKRFDPSTKELEFYPSAIAIHPKSKEYYILSSSGKMLAVFNPSFKLKELYKLDKNIFPQPEGICFDNKNNLYISSEGKEGFGRILRFDTKAK